MAELKKFFNVNGSCNPQIHYMIDLSERLSEIKKMVDAGDEKNFLPFVYFFSFFCRKFARKDKYWNP